jgi:hypothetical protein
MPVSGGGSPFFTPNESDHVHDPVRVASKAATPPPALHELDQAKLLQLVKVALYRPRRSTEDLG